MAYISACLLNFYLWVGDRVQDLYAYFRVLADRKRFRMLHYLARHDEITVTDLSAELRMSQPLISWHLRKMRRIGLVTTRRSGRQVLCSLNRPAFKHFQQKLDDTLGLNAPIGEEFQATDLEEVSGL